MWTQTIAKLEQEVAITIKKLEDERNSYRQQFDSMKAQKDTVDRALKDALSENEQLEKKLDLLRDILVGKKPGPKIPEKKVEEEVIEEIADDTPRPDEKKN